MQKPEPIRREEEKVGRNESCPCGSGLKYKKCCLLLKAQLEQLLKREGQL